MSEIKKITGEEPINPTGLWGQQHCKGIDLRTHIATHIMAARMGTLADRVVTPGLLEGQAKICVNSADALVAALNKTPNPNK